MWYRGNFHSRSYLKCRRISTLSNYIKSRNGLHSYSSDISPLFTESNLEPNDCINILKHIYKNKCRLELEVIQRAELYTIFKDIISGGIQNPLPLNRFTSNPVSTYFDLKFSPNRINTLLANQIDVNSDIYLKHSTFHRPNIYLLPIDGIETMGSLNNTVLFEDAIKESEERSSFYSNLDSTLNAVFNKADFNDFIKILKYLYLLDIPLNVNILSNLSIKFVSNISKLSSFSISETSYIFSSYFNDMSSPNIVNYISYHSQLFLYKNLKKSYDSIVPALFLLHQCKGKQTFFKPIINKLIYESFMPDALLDCVRLQTVLSQIDFGNDSTSKELSQELNNKILGHFSDITEPDVIYIAKMLSHGYSKPICDKLFNFVEENLSDLHMDTISSVYLYLSEKKQLTPDHQKMLNKLLQHINNNMSYMSSGLIPDIYIRSIKQGDISEEYSKLVEKNIMLNKSYLTTKDISNMIISITLHGKSQNNLIKILVDQFLHLKKQGRSLPQDSLDIILALSLAGVKHPEMWNNLDLPILLNNISNTMLVYIGYAFLMTDYNCRTCWSILVERLLYENIPHSADIFVVLQVAKLLKYISLQTENAPVNCAVISDKSTINKFNTILNHCKNININKLNSKKTKPFDEEPWKELLTYLNVSYECNFIIEDLYKVSIYMPSHNIIVDVVDENGAACTGRLNGEIELKHKVLRAIGYNVTMLKTDWIKSIAKENLKRRAYIFSNKIDLVRTSNNIIKKRS